MQIRCPHCRNPVKVLDDSSLSSIACASCGSYFSLVADETVSHHPAPSKIGRFELLQPIGRGSFGTVWKARDPELDRIVALKIPRTERLSEHDTELFLREARAAAQLEHPQIVSVHEVGREKSTLFIVADFIQGVTLEDWLTAQRPSIRDAVELIAQVAEALHVAHEKGVVHRDLKPSNIMLDEDQQPHVMDFGLAKRDTGEVTMTMDGQILGTPAYMAPEQARGDAHNADRQADIYALGVILFELVCGEKPFRGNARMLLHQVIHEPAPSPRKLNSTVPRDIETIVLRCLEKNPDSRFPTAAELARDLRRFLEDKPVASRPIGRWARGWRWCRRNPQVATLTSVVALLLLALSIGATIFAVVMARKNQSMGSQLRVADSLRLAGRSQLVHDKLPVRSHLLALEAVDLTRRRGEPVLPFAHQSLLLAVARGGTGKALAGHTKTVTCVAWSPQDGRLLASGSLDRTVHVWENADVPKRRLRVELDSVVRSVAIGPKAGWVVAGCSNGTAHLQRIPSAVGKPSSGFALQGHRTAVTFVAFSGNGRWVVTAGAENEAKLWDLSRRDPSAAPLPLVGHTAPLSALAISPDGHLLATGSQDKTIRLWNLDDSQPATVGQILNGHEGTVNCLAISANHRRIAVGTATGKIHIWDRPGGAAFERSHVYPGRNPVTSIAIARQGQRLVTSSKSETARLWNIEVLEKEKVTALHGHEDDVTRLTVSVDGRWLATATGNFKKASGDRTARVWDLDSANPANESFGLRGHEFPVHAVAIDPGGRWLATGGGDNTVRLWDLAAARPSASPNVLTDHRSVVRTLAISPNGRWLVTGSGDGQNSQHDKSVRVWNLATRPPTASSVLLSGQRSYIRRVIISGDGRWLAVAGSDNTVRIWQCSDDGPKGSPRVFAAGPSTRFSIAFNGSRPWLVGGGGQRVWAWNLKAETGDEKPFDLTGHSKSVLSVAAGPAGRWVVAGSEDGTLTFWDLTTKRPSGSVATRAGQQGSIGRLAIGPKGRWLASAGSDHSVRLWDLSSGRPQPVARLEEHTMTITGLAFSPDGRWLLTASSDTTARMWDLAAEDVATSHQVLEGHEADLWSVAISHDNRWAVTTCRDHTARLWDLKAKNVSASSVVLRGHNFTVTTAAFSKDDWIVTASYDKTVRLWDVDLDRLIRSARRSAGRELRQDERAKYDLD